eukprot:CAMPEP_0184754862 /NCGR_PEP_ID=MMETSP0315-20130426/44848_1 /TAXON_ID=101924 /ORGANISM="Rhodosorus marinus, Strain UTEX LB 2760" /LENGTH=728 /DNA_ID=CAMNT_0027234307 /DNA_START=202 /DNA_END=2388 /DNA_ORIENTATION=+
MSAEASHSRNGWEETLTNEQEAVVNADAGEALSVIAGAGSGKTRVIVARASRLIAQGIYPVLLLSFSRAAAEQLRHGLGKCVQQRTAVPEESKFEVSTFHALGLRILRSCTTKVLLQKTGRSKGFSIFSFTEQRSIAQEVLRELGKEGSPASILKSILSSRHHPQSKSSAEAQAASQLYEKKLIESNAFDIEQLVLAAALILESESSVRKQWQNHFKGILVDEFQDVSLSNFNLLLQLCGTTTSVTVVGDDDQSIYSFRGSIPEVFKLFEAKFQGTKKRLKLVENFRSQHHIVEAASVVISDAPNRLPKVLKTSNPPGAKVKIVSCINADHEGQYLAQQIKRLHAELSIPYSEIAVLSRTRARSLEIRSRLEDKSIPTTMMAGKGRGMSFWSVYQDSGSFESSRMPTASSAALAMVRLVCNESDRSSFALLAKVFEVPYNVVQTLLGEGGDILTAAIRMKNTASKENRKQLFQLLLVVDKLKQYLTRTAGSVSLRQFIYQALSLLPLDDQYSGSSEKVLAAAQEADSIAGEDSGSVCFRSGKSSHDAEDDMALLLKGSKRPSVHRAAPISNGKDHRRSGVDRLRRTLDNFVQLEADNEISAASVLNKSVICTTIHQSKGLEWRVVLLPGMNDGNLPLRNQYAESRENIDEERRLCYVAFTRAREKLLISYIVQDMNLSQIPSCFLQRLPQSCTEREALGDMNPVDHPLSIGPAKPRGKRPKRKAKTNG